MKRRAISRWVVGAAASTMLVMVIASPASAHVAIGVKDNFFLQCDASVYISDELIGSPGMIEAWGGYSCPNPTSWGGQMTLQIFKDGVKVREVKKNSFAATDHIDASISNSSGTQHWQARLFLFRPGFSTTLIVTGEIPS